MRTLRLLLVVVVLAIIGVAGYDFVQISNAHKDISNTAHSAASAAAAAITSSHNPTTGRAAADKVAKDNSDVVTRYTYDPVHLKVTVTVSGTAHSLVAHLFDRKLTQDITATGSATT